MKFPFILMRRSAWEFCQRRVNHTREANATLREDNAELRRLVSVLRQDNAALSDELAQHRVEDGRSDVELTQAIRRLESLGDDDPRGE